VSTLNQTALPLAVAKPWPTLKLSHHAVALLAVAYSTVAVAGVVSNVLVIGVICAQPRMRTVTNYFLANLATADILVCALVLPVTLLQNVYTGNYTAALLRMHEIQTIVTDDLSDSQFVMSIMRLNWASLCKNG